MMQAAAIASAALLGKALIYWGYLAVVRALARDAQALRAGWGAFHRAWLGIFILATVAWLGSRDAGAATFVLWMGRLIAWQCAMPIAWPERPGGAVLTALGGLGLNLVLDAVLWGLLIGEPFATVDLQSIRFG